MNLINNRSFVRMAVALIACLMVIGVAQTTFAQTTGSAALRGTVKDPQGAIVRGATVTLTNERTKDERKTVNPRRWGFYFFGAESQVSTPSRSRRQASRRLSGLTSQIETSSTTLT